jgi:hypothetical protein
LAYADRPREQKDDICHLCNYPWNVQKLCNGSGATSCNTALLKGTCLNPESCNKLTVLDTFDKINGVQFPGGKKKQAVFVKNCDYLGWEDSSIVNSPSIVKEYKLVID